MKTYESVQEIVEEEKEKWNDGDWLATGMDKLLEMNSSVKKYGFFHISRDKFFASNEIFAVKQHGAPFRPLKGIGSLPHNHEYFEISYQYSGRAENCIQNDLTVMHKGAIAMINPNICHDYRTMGGDSFAFIFGISHELLHNILQPFIMENHIFFHFFMDYSKGTGAMQNYLLFQPEELTEEIWEILHEIILEYYNKKRGYSQIIQGKLIVLFTLLMRAYDKYYQMTTDRFSEKTVLTLRILQDIRYNCNTVTLSELSDTYAYSPRHIQKLIKEFTGKNYSDILRKYRLEKIRILLDTSDMPIHNMVEMSGFNDLSYLNKAFKKEYGVTLSQYRRMREDESAAAIPFSL